MNTQQPSTQEKPLFMKMEEQLSFYEMNAEQQRMYMDSLNNYRTVMAAKEYDYQRGYKEGLKMAKEERLAEFLIKVATKLKSFGVDPDTIREITDISLQDIENL